MNQVFWRVTITLYHEQVSFMLLIDTHVYSRSNMVHGNANVGAWSTRPMGFVLKNQTSTSVQGHGNEKKNWWEETIYFSVFTFLEKVACFPKKVWVSSQKYCISPKSFTFSRKSTEIQFSGGNVILCTFELLFTIFDVLYVWMFICK